MYPITTKQYTEWKIASMIITNFNEDLADEILIDVLESLGKKMKKDKEFKVTDNYTPYVSLKNAYLDIQRSKCAQKNKKEFLEEDKIPEIVDEFTLEEMLDNDMVMQSKLKAITEAYTNVLDSTEQKLYFAHYVKGLSQREIGRRTGIQSRTICRKVNKIKQKIKQYYEENN